VTSQSKEVQPNPAGVSQEEMDELKRDMRSAHLTAWAKENQQKMIAAVAALLLVIVGVSLWKEHIATQRASAATLYHQALNTVNLDAKRSMLEKVVRDYGNTSYREMAQLLLAKVDQAHAGQYLMALLSNSGMNREIRWQAQLDLAQFYLRRDNKAKARAMLAKSVGRDYEQLRHHLMADASENNTDRISHLEQALNSVSHDTVLKKRIEQRLTKLKHASGTSVSTQ